MKMEKKIVKPNNTIIHLIKLKIRFLLLLTFFLGDYKHIAELFLEHQYDQQISFHHF